MGLKELTKRLLSAALRVLPDVAEAQRLYDALVQGEQAYLERRRTSFQQRAGVWEDPEQVFSDAKQVLLQAPPRVQIEFLLRAITVDRQKGYWASSLREIREQVFYNNLPFTAHDLERLLYASLDHDYYVYWDKQYAPAVAAFLQSGGTLTPALRDRLTDFRNAELSTVNRPNRILRAQLDKFLGTVTTYLPDKGEAWADNTRADIDAMGAEQQAAWSALLTFAVNANGSKPSPKWQKEAQKQIDPIGSDEFTRRVARWFLLVTMPPTTNSGNPTSEGEGFVVVAQSAEPRLSEKNLDLLKGLAWCCAGRSEPELARALGHLADAAFRKLPGVGPWASRAGNAALWALGQMTCASEAVGQLAALRVKMRDRGALKIIAASIEQAAKLSGMSAEELEDLAVPIGGLNANGTREETFGDEGRAVLTLDAQTGRITVQWFGGDGKPRKAVPAGVKKQFGAEVKELKAVEDEIRQALSAQSARLDRALLDERTWPYAEWEARFLSHPILGNLARRLVWVEEAPPAPQVWGEDALQPGSVSPFLAGQEQSTDSNLELPPLKPGGQGGPPSRVKLWHPLTSAPAEVMRWRDTLADAGIVQPFKQAHREVYLLTDAERATRTYSNRFAAHILKQHQFNSLCVLRGWKNQLRLMVDNSYPPATRELPRHNLRAEFWVEGIGDDYGTDTNDNGTYLRVATDQVRFYRTDAPANFAHAGGGGYAPGGRQQPAEPLPLEEVSPLALSEVMRDIDLFVGVASLGNDPAWADGGSQGRFRAYWQDYAFGELAESAKTRAAVLERLLPRLKIAPRCTLDGRFLHVQGDVRAYKIHLGSGNILMEPNDQYLCIVPNSRANGDSGAGDLFLPFEGDRTLAVILSKAFLLANDKSITDSTITRQIGVK